MCKPSGFLGPLFRRKRIHKKLCGCESQNTPPEEGEEDSKKLLISDSDLKKRFKLKLNIYYVEERRVQQLNKKGHHVVKH